MPNQQPTLPAPEFLPHRKPTFELPPVPAPAPNRLGSGQYLFVHDIVITGNTVVASAELAAIGYPRALAT